MCLCKYTKLCIVKAYRFLRKRVNETQTQYDIILSSPVISEFYFSEAHQRNRIFVLILNAVLFLKINCI